MAREKSVRVNHAQRRIGVLYSGGLDSAALVAHYLDDGWDVSPVYVRTGLRWEETELAGGQAFLRKIAQVNLRPLGLTALDIGQAYDHNWSRTGRTPKAGGADVDVFLPGRNLLLTTKAVLLLSSQKISNLAIATLKNNPFPDATSRYFKMLERVLAAGFGTAIRIHAPFRRLTKVQLIRSFRNYPIDLTMSCIDPRLGTHCGTCNKCGERRQAFREAGVPDVTVYRAQRTNGI